MKQPFRDQPSVSRVLRLLACCCVPLSTEICYDFTNWSWTHETMSLPYKHERLCSHPQQPIAAKLGRMCPVTPAPGIENRWIPGAHWAAGLASWRASGSVIPFLRKPGRKWSRKTFWIDLLASAQAHMNMYRTKWSIWYISASYRHIYAHEYISISTHTHMFNTCTCIQKHMSTSVHLHTHVQHMYRTTWIH